MFTYLYLEKKQYKDTTKLTNISLTASTPKICSSRFTASMVSKGSLASEVCEISVKE